MRRNKPIDIHREFYSMASTDKDSVEINMYGDVCEEWPVDYWTGEKLKGNFITQEDFLADLDRLSKAKNITIRMNSYGGDCVVAFTIHNKLREFARDGKNTICIVDGVAMSAGSIIMAACDTVKVNPASLVMIHKCWAPMMGGYNADELKEQAEQMDAYDKAIASTYARKTGLSTTQIMHMMGETTYMTGKEALEKGFANELLEDAEPLNLAASADGCSIYCRGREIHLAPGMFAPDEIPTIDDAELESIKAETRECTEETPEHAHDEANIKTPEDTGSTEGGSPIMTMDELRGQYPDLVAEVEANATAGNTEAINNAVMAERQRISDIDNIAHLFTADLVAEAKYGENACNAEQLAYRAALKAKQDGLTFMAQAEADAAEAGAEEVGPAPAPEETPVEALTESQKKEMAEQMFKSLLNKKED